MILKRTRSRTSIRAAGSAVAHASRVRRQVAFGVCSERMNPAVPAHAAMRYSELGRPRGVRVQVPPPTRACVRSTTRGQYEPRVFRVKRMRAGGHSGVVPGAISEATLLVREHLSCTPPLDPRRCDDCRRRPLGSGAGYLPAFLGQDTLQHLRRARTRRPPTHRSRARLTVTVSASGQPFRGGHVHVGGGALVTLIGGDDRVDRPRFWRRRRAHIIG